jgi:omega-amidase
MFGAQIAATAPHSDLIVLPEMFSTGFTMDAANNNEQPDGETARWLQNMAREHATALCGSLIIKDGEHTYNRLLWASPDGNTLSYDKRHLFRMANEQDHYSAGKQRLVVQYAGWRICPLICYDLRFPVWSRNNNSYDLLIYVANWPAPRSSAWRSLLPARSIENLCYAAGVNRVGTDGNNVNYQGESMITDHLGTVLADGSDTVTAVNTTLSLDKLDRYRQKFPAWKDADQFTLTDSSS